MRYIIVSSEEEAESAGALIGLMGALAIIGYGHIGVSLLGLLLFFLNWMAGSFDLHSLYFILGLMCIGATPATIAHFMCYRISGVWSFSKAEIIIR